MLCARWIEVDDWMAGDYPCLAIWTAGMLLCMFSSVELPMYTFHAHSCMQSFVFFILYSCFDGYLSNWQPVVPLWNLVIDGSSTSSAACLSQLVGRSTTFACALVQLFSTF